MGLIDQIAESAIKTVTIERLEFKIRRVRSADLARAGSAQLLAMLSTQDMAQIKDVSQAEAAQLLMDRFRNLTDVQLTRMSHSQEAMVCAGVTALRETGSTDWEPIAVSTSKPSSEEAGVLNVGDLPDSYRKRLSEEIMAHSVDDGGLQLSLETFRS